MYKVLYQETAVPVRVKWFVKALSKFSAFKNGGPHIHRYKLSYSLWRSDQK